MSSLNPFQWIALCFLLCVLVFELSLALRGPVRRTLWVLRVSAWIAAGVAIYRPSLLTELARWFGIQRGADLVLYVAVLGFLGTSLFLYARCLQLQQQITQIVRHLAIAEARDPQGGERGT